MDEPEPLAGCMRSFVNFRGPKDANSNLARELLQAFRRHASRTLLVDTQSGRHWTGGQLLEHTGRLATGFIRQLGFKPGGVVLTICDHSDQEIAMAMGVVLAGAGLFGVSPSDGLSEIQELCNILKPDVIVVSGAHRLLAAQLCQRVAGLQDSKIVWLDRPSEQQAATNGALSSSGRQNGLDDWRQVHLLERLIEQTADWELLESIAYEQLDSKRHMITYMLTSGSTGRPKLVPWTHAQLIYGLYRTISACSEPFATQQDENNNCSADNLGQELVAPLMPCGPDDVISGDLPLDHGAGFNMLLLSLWMGAKFIVMPSYDEDAFWAAVSKHKITFSFSSTTFSYRLFSRLKAAIEAQETDQWDLSSFRHLSCCGAKLAFIELIREVKQHYKQLHVTQSYGCTEIGFISIVHINECDTHLDSVGYLAPGIFAKVIDREQQPERLCGPGERGELLLWARSKFQGYLCHKDDDERQIYANCHDERGFFYRTGDQAHFDSAGRLYLHGRFKDTLVLMEDWKIMPAELEEVVNQHPLVEQSVVVGMPDPNLPGCHAPRAFVKLISLDSIELRELAHRDSQLSARLRANDLTYLAGHIYDFVAARTARPKHLTGGVRILDEFPRVGLLNKVDRKALKLLS